MGKFKHITTVLLIVFSTLLPFQALAFTPQQRFEIERTPQFDPTDVPCGTTTITTSVSSTLPNDLPEPVRTMITKAANSQQTDPLALMALFMVENGIQDYRKANIKGSNPEDYNKGWPTSSAGAQGPFQFLPSSFPKDAGDINNFQDAANAAAKVFLKDIAQIPASGAKEGELAAKEKGTLSYLFGAYNGGPGYSPGSVQGYVTLALKHYKELQAGSSGSGGAGSGTIPAQTTHKDNPLLPAAHAEETQPTTVDNKPAPGKVFVIGDSITFQSKANILAKFAAVGYTDVEVDGLSSRGLTGGGPSPTGLEVINSSTEKIKASKAVVIALGTNAYNVTTFGNDIKTAIGAVKAANPEAKIYWVDVAGRFQDKPSLASTYQNINKAIYDNKAEGYSVISWFKTVYPQGDPTDIKPGLVDTNNLITNSDGLAVHPTSPAGQDAFGAVIAENVSNGGGSAVGVQKSNDCNKNGAQGVGTCVDDGRLFTINVSDEELGKVIDDYAKSKGLGDAPLANLGAKFVSGAKRAGVNPFLLVQIAIQESSYGKAIPDNSYNSFGRTATASQPNVTANGRLWYKYDSFSDSLDGGGIKDDQPTYVKKVYLDEGKITISDIIMKYAPPGDGGNNPEQYIAGIKKTIQELVTASGDKISCGESTSSASADQDTSNIPCPTIPGISEVGIEQDKGPGGVDTVKIMVCNVDGIQVNTTIAAKLKELLDAAKADGVIFGGGGFRSFQRQVELRTINGCPDVYTAPASSCRVPTAIPGTSMHEVGLAIDFTQNGSTLSKGSSGYNWLKTNADKYGFKNLPSEPWHWSINGK